MSPEISCPVCGKIVALAVSERPAAFPFCSARCRVLDLGAWADGRYVVAGRELSDVVESDHPRGDDQRQ